MEIIPDPLRSNSSSRDARALDMQCAIHGRGYDCTRRAILSMRTLYQNGVLP